MDIGKKRKYGSRLFQLALNDAVQSRMCLVSPVRMLMEKEKMEKRKSKCIKSKITIQSDMPEKKSSSASSDEFAPKIGEMTQDLNTAIGLKNESIFILHSDSTNDDFSTKNERDMSHTEITCTIGDQQSGGEVWTPKPCRSSLLDDFECSWIQEENDSSSDISEKSISIELNSPEWDKIESKCASFRDSNSETSINYDLPVFPLNVVSEGIPTQEPLQKSFFDRDLNSKMSDLTPSSLKNSHEFTFPSLGTPALEFLQESEVLNNFIPPPRVMSIKQNSGDKEIAAPYVHEKTISRSCISLNSPKCISEKLCTYESQARLNGVNNSSKFDQYLTLRHFKSMLSENPTESFENTVETNFLGNYPFNYSHVDCTISKPHSSNMKMYGDSLEQTYKSHHNFNYIKTSCTYGNPSGLLEHFPEFKPLI